jgi:Protein of unknown function (DUF669)
MNGKYNWGEALKADVSAMVQNGGNNSGGERTPAKPIAPGRYAAFIQAIKHGTFKTGSYGLTTTYVIEGGDFKNRKINDNLVLQKADGTAVKGADARLKRFLMAGGLSSEKINAFKGPRTEHELGDFKLLIQEPVTIVVKDDGEYEGRPSRKVAGVYVRTVSEAA